MKQFEGTKGDLSFSPQTESVYKDGQIIGCNQAQVWDSNGKSLAIIEPTNGEEIATKYAQMFAAAPELLKVAQKIKFLENLIRYPEDVKHEHKDEAFAIHNLLNDVDFAIEKALK